MVFCRPSELQERNADGGSHQLQSGGTFLPHRSNSPATLTAGGPHWLWPETKLQWNIFVGGDSFPPACLIWHFYTRPWKHQESVCVCVCGCVFVIVCEYMIVCVSVYVWLCVWLYACVCGCECVRVIVCVWLCVSVCVWLWVLVSVCVSVCLLRCPCLAGSLYEVC